MDDHSGARPDRESRSGPPIRRRRVTAQERLRWVSRAEIVGGNAHLVGDNGIFRPFAPVGSRAVGLGRIAGGRVELPPFEPIEADVGAALEREARDVVRFLGLDVARVG